MGLFNSKKMAHEAMAEYATDVIIHFDWSITEKTHGNMESICLIAGPREARNSNLDSDQRIVYYAFAPRL